MLLPLRLLPLVGLVLRVGHPPAGPAEGRLVLLLCRVQAAALPGAAAQALAASTAMALAAATASDAPAAIVADSETTTAAATNAPGGTVAAAANAAAAANTRSAADAIANAGGNVAVADPGRGLQGGRLPQCGRVHLQQGAAGPDHTRTGGGRRWCFSISAGWRMPALHPNHGWVVGAYGQPHR